MIEIFYLTSNHDHEQKPDRLSILISYQTVKESRRKMPHTAETEKNKLSDAEVKLVETF